MDTVTCGCRKLFETMKGKCPATQPQGTSSSEPPTLPTHQPTTPSTHKPLFPMANETMKGKCPETSIPDTTQPQGMSSSELPTLSTHQPTTPSTHKPLFPMANDPYVLWCLIKGSSNLFNITVPVATSFSRLKDLVWEKRKNGVL